MVNKLIFRNNSWFIFVPRQGLLMSIACASSSHGSAHLGHWAGPKCGVTWLQQVWVLTCSGLVVSTYGHQKRASSASAFPKLTIFLQEIPSGRGHGNSLCFRAGDFSQRRPRHVPVHIPEVTLETAEYLHVAGHALMLCRDVDVEYDVRMITKKNWGSQLGTQKVEYVELDSDMIFRHGNLLVLC